MLNHYETLFIMTPVLSEKQIKETADKFKKILKEKKSKIIYTDSWGLRKLAYPIKKKATGFYYLIEFEAKGDTVSELESGLKREEKILRFLTVKMDKHSIAFAEKTRKEKNNQSNTDKEKDDKKVNKKVSKTIK